MSSKVSNEPVDSLQDNMIMDIGDSMITGMAAHFLVSWAFSKNPSFKNVLSLGNVKDGLKYGVAVGAYKRLGRPAINQIMNRGGLGDMMKL